MGNAVGRRGVAGGEPIDEREAVNDGREPPMVRPLPAPVPVPEAE